MTPNVELMRSAKASLQGQWGNAALTTLVRCLILGAASFVAVGQLLLGGPIEVGYIRFLRKIKEKEDAKLDLLFSSFSDFARTFVGYLIMSVLIVLWMILLIVPGIIMSYAYGMTLFIMEDDTTIQGMDAIKRSKEMMRGYKWKLFCLQLRFIGWILLGFITFGIGLFWVLPYIQMATLNFYEDVKADYASRNTVSVE